jgi:hypothetical protein
MDFPISVRDTGKHRYIFVIMLQILFPYLNGFIVLIDGLVTVGQAEKGVVVSRIMIQTALVIDGRVAA